MLGVLSQEGPNKGSGREVPDHGRGETTWLDAMSRQGLLSVSDLKSRQDIWWCLDLDFQILGLD